MHLKYDIMKQRDSTQFNHTLQYSKTIYTYSNAGNIFINLAKWIHKNNNAIDDKSSHTCSQHVL